MRIICTDTRSEFCVLRSEYKEDKRLTLGKNYIVYALTKDSTETDFCIFNDISCDPMWYPERCFKIIDPRLSRYWIFNFWQDRNRVNCPILAFPEWANDEYFHWNLVESDPNAWKIFRKYEKLMKLEFPDPAIVETAQIGDDNWLICPLCIDAWESKTLDALVICPKCHHVYNNPRYHDEMPSYKSGAL
jgi:hypothetical protein